MKKYKHFFPKGYFYNSKIKILKSLIGYAKSNKEIFISKIKEERLNN